MNKKIIIIACKKQKLAIASTFLFGVIFIKALDVGIQNELVTKKGCRIQNYAECYSRINNIARTDMFGQVIAAIFFGGGALS